VVKAVLFVGLRKVAPMRRRPIGIDRWNKVAVLHYPEFSSGARLPPDRFRYALACPLLVFEKGNGRVEMELFHVQLADHTIKINRWPPYFCKMLAVSSWLFHQRHASWLP
jgi:hypothetical protein